ncbi:MAG: OPT family oligopeptide transporter [Planctomycetota bacterium]|nr:OPT family oligopeptide transporter [Planctomycetota bacterium]
MGLFQKAPRTAEEFDACSPLELTPAEVAEFDEEQWYQHAYRGETPQLTLRAVLMGSVLGFFLAFTNLYIGLKTGWHLGVAITACILSYSIWQVLLKAGLAKTNMTILENNCMQSTASAAGYSTGGTFVSAIAALLMIQQVHLPIWVLVVWTVFLAILGVTLAIPMKRNMINQEKLKFPSGLAAASTLQSLYADGAEATKKARALMWSALGGALVPILIDANLLIDKVRSTGDAVVYKTLLPGYSKLFDWLPQVGTKMDGDQKVTAMPSDWTIKMDHNPVMIAAGALVGLRVAIWMAVSGLVLAFLLGPAAQLNIWENLDGEKVAAVTKPGRAWKEIGLWLGAPIMVASGLMSFAFQWKTIARAITGVGKSGGSENVKDGVEVPNSWFMIGMIFSGAGVVFIANHQFEVPVHLGVLAVALTFILALVACRATGESDITPTGAMGKIMQLTYGVLIPQSSTANLMTAGITSGAASSSADLLNDLKSGYLLGANPRRQFIAQFMGIFSGTIATVVGFKLLVPDATALLGKTLADGTEIAPAFPAPAAVAWKAVADVFEQGIGNLHEMHRQAIYVGLAIGAALVLVDRYAPKTIKKYLPSATGVGLGFILPFQYPLSMLIGAVIAYYWNKRNEKQCDDYMIPIASGIIAGVSIMGVVAAAVNNFVFVNG